MSDADTKHAEYVRAVAEGRWPENPSVPLPGNFTDARGVIQNLMFADLSSVALITSARGSVRANHYHRTDWHYSYVLSGSILYYERPVGSTDRPTPRSYGPGDMFFTKPMVEHAMVFTDDTTFLTFAKNVRTHDNHEQDVVRVAVVDPADAEFLYGTLR